MNREWIKTLRARVLTWGDTAVAGATRIATRNPSVTSDTPLIDPKADVLNRHRIAREIYHIISDSSADESVRIGLFGDWGYGKTTIANWVGALAEQDKHIVVLFNPWAVRDVSELWLNFALSLQEHLSKEGIEIPQWSGLKMLLARAQKEYGQLGASIVGSRISGATSAILRFSRADAATLRNALGNRRVVVCIDDIDRADPSILPQLFLCLRELLDLPGFAFLLPFEKGIVSAALLKHHPAWGSGERFLEKILDVQIAIPESTTDERWRLFVESLGVSVPTKELAQFAPLLPDNPRRIKRIGKDFGLFKQAIERHHEREIDWPSLLFGSLMKLESHDFFKRYVARAFMSTDERIAEGMADDPRTRNEARERRISKLFDDCKIEEGERRVRLKALAEKWEQERSYWFGATVAYTLRLFDQPDIFTWREIDDLLEEWARPADLAAVNTVIADKEAVFAKSRDAVSKDLIESLCKKFHEHLEAAANGFSTVEHQQSIRHARYVLDRLDAFAATLSIDGRFALFSGLLETHRTWGHFTANQEDASIRSAEKALLTKLVDARGEDWQRYAGALGTDRFGDHRQDYNTFVASLRSKCVGDAEARALQALQESKGIPNLLREKSDELAQELLLDADSTIWSAGVGSSKCEQLLLTARDQALIQSNAHTLLRFASEDGGGVLAIDRRQLIDLLKVERVAVALWDAAISTPIQYRMLHSTRRIRSFLIENGIAADKLSFPDWLHAGEEREDQQRQQPVDD